MNDRGIPTTLEEIEALPKNILCPEDVCGYLECDKYSINCASKAGQLPFAYQKGTRTVIPKEAFLNYHRYGRLTVVESGLYTDKAEKAAQLMLREEMARAKNAAV